jgi:cardiolipin synthase
MLVDGFGSSELSEPFITSLTQAGVRLRVFDPASKLLGWRFNVLRRMHRKIVVVDESLAFVGGINFSFDHLRASGPESKQDYAVAVRGPIVAHIHRFVRAVADQADHRAVHLAATNAPDTDTMAPAGDAQMIFVTRDNHRHRNTIERHYRVAIRAARKRVVLANAYFFPGYLLLRQMKRAARRGVLVSLILQGEPDMPIAKLAASLLYGSLQRSGVHIYEYCERPLHGKVAVVDDDWSTVGSSNLDPLSLTLNLEANLVIRDAAFAQGLAVRLQDLIDHHCKSIAPEPPAPAWAFWRPLSSFLLFHLLSGYSRWANWLPYHAPIMQTMGSQGPGAASPSPGARDGAT